MIGIESHVTGQKTLGLPGDRYHIPPLFTFTDTIYDFKIPLESYYCKLWNDLTGVSCGLIGNHCGKKHNP